MELTDTGHWRKPVERPKRPAFLDINFSINSGSLARIGLVVAVLLILWQYRPHKPHKPKQSAPEPAPVHAVSAPPARPAPPASPNAVQEPNSQPRPPQAAPLDLTQLNGLSGDEPTYVFTAANLAAFALPIDSISRFQILIKKLDHINIHPNNIALSVEHESMGLHRMERK